MDYTEPCQYSIRLLEKLESLDTRKVLDFDLVNKAIYWAKKYHGKQKRKSGEAYYTHPLEVAYIISDYNLTTDIIIASILHDIVEDTEVSVGMIQGTFGERIAEMVDRLTRDKPDGTKLSIEEILNTAYQKGDKEVLLIKLIDRLHNMQTIGVKFLDKQIKESKETLQNFVSLAMYLENIDLEKAISCLCHKISSDQEKVNKIRFMYDFLKQDDSYRLPSLIE